jgi:hypothetical protein
MGSIWQDAMTGLIAVALIPPHLYSAQTENPVRSVSSIEPGVDPRVRMFTKGFAKVVGKSVPENIFDVGVKITADDEYLRDPKHLVQRFGISNHIGRLRRVGKGAFFAPCPRGSSEVGTLRFAHPTSALIPTCHSGARAQHANPESRRRCKKVWIPGSRLAARPGMTVALFAT